MPCSVLYTSTCRPEDEVAPPVAGAGAGVGAGAGLGAGAGVVISEVWTVPVVPAEVGSPACAAAAEMPTTATQVATAPAMTVLVTRFRIMSDALPFRVLSARHTVCMSDIHKPRRASSRAQ